MLKVLIRTMRPKQWYKTDGPEKWELPIVFSKHDFIPATAEPIFPILYDYSKMKR